MSRGDSTSWTLIPDSMRASFPHDPLSTNSQSRLTSDPSNYQLSSRMDPSRARRVQGLPDSYSNPELLDEKDSTLPKFIKRLHTYGTRRGKSNTDWKPLTTTTEEAIGDFITNSSDAVRSPSDEGETIVVQQIARNGDDWDAQVRDLSEGGRGRCFFGQDNAASVVEQDAVATSDSIRELRGAENGDAPDHQAADEEEDISNNGEDDEVVQGTSLSLGQRSIHSSEREEVLNPEIGGDGISNAHDIIRHSENNSTTGSVFDKDKDEDLEKGGSLAEEISHAVPVVLPKRGLKKLGKHQSKQKKHVIDAIIGHRLGSQRKPDFLVKWRGYSETTWEPGSILREDVPWLLIDYLEENIVYGENEIPESSEPSPKKPKARHPTPSGASQVRGRLRNLRSRPDITIEDSQSAPESEKESASTPQAATKSKLRDRRPKAKATLIEDSSRQFQGRRRRSSSSVPSAIPVKKPQPPTTATEFGMESEGEPM